MTLAYFEGAGAALSVEQYCAHIGERVTPGTHAFIQARTDYPVNELLQILNIPPALHVRFAEAERSLPQNPRIEVLLQYANVPRVSPIDVNSALLEQRFDGLARSARVGRREIQD